jgi:prepilin-type processing-associated H-X9-DG protein
VDVAGLAQNLLQAHPEDAVPPLVAMAKSKSAVALAVVPYEEAIAFDVVAENETVKQSIATLAHVVGASFQAARAQARRALCMAQMKSVLQGCMIYANDHKNQWPESLEVLAQSGILGDPQAAAKILADPYEEPGNTPTGVYYLYRPAGDFRHSPQEPGTYIVLSEPYVHDGGACFGFADGHVEWIAEPQAEGRLSTMRQGR